MLSRLLTALSIAVTVALSAHAAEPGGRLAIDLANVRWQQPPKEVFAVYVGPDGRTWYQLNSDPQGRTPDQIRRSLEAEYRQPTPQISGASVALLEPTGRAWFYVNLGKTLLGYDGQKWIERDAPAKSSFVGVCPTRGALPDNLSNRFAGDKAWFRDWQGIHVFDGKEWSYQPFYEPITYGPAQPEFTVSPNGKCAAAMLARWDAQKGIVGTDLWLFHEGKWHKRDTPLATQAGTVRQFCITDEGVLWYVWNASLLRSLRLGGYFAGKSDDQIREQIAGLIAQLGNEAFQIRETAAESLARFGMEIKPQLEAAHKTTADAETRLRLEQLLTRLQEQPIKSLDAAVTIADVRVKMVTGLFQDEEGRMYVFAEGILRGEEAPVNGLAIIARDVKTRVVSVEENLAGMRMSGANNCSPVLTPNREGLWLPHSPSGAAVRRLDLATGRIGDQLPDARIGNVQAVDRDGRVFASRDRTSPHGHSATGLAVFCPAVEEAHPLPELVTFDISHGNFIMAPDGVVWANHKGDGLARFNGRTWEIVRREEKITPVLCGLERVVIATADGIDYRLFQGGKLLGQGSLRKLIQQHRATIAASFTPQTPQVRPNGCWITADLQGNIWLLELGRPAVLVGDTWIEAKNALWAADAREFGACFMSAVGRGSQVYLSNLMLVNERGKSIIAEVKEGVLKISEAPHVTDHSGTSRLGLRDLEGGIWLPRVIAVAVGMSDQVKGLRTSRLTDGGELQEFPNYWPQLVDRSDNVWMTKVRPPSATQLQIWRRGKIVQELEVPQANALYGLFSDRPGSVYAWTPLGLQRFVANKGSKEGSNDGKYEFDAIYPLPKLPSVTTHFAYSTMGFLVVGSSQSIGQRQVHFVQIPPR